MPVLVHFSHDWADEFDVKGFTAFKEKERFDTWYKAMIEDINSGESSYYFGTNEGFDGGEIDSDFFERGCTIREITDEQYEVLRVLFDNTHDNRRGIINYGNSPF